MVMTTGLKNYSDVHYTHPDIAGLIVDFFKPTGKVLEPFLGGSAFFDKLPKGSLWCELEKGRDFFDFTSNVSWIVTNPPYSNLTDVMLHAFSISKKTVLLVPLSKIYSSSPRMKLVNEVAGIHRQLYLGPGRNIGFDTGFPFAAIEFISGYHGPTYTIDVSSEVKILKIPLVKNS
jgi:hypothetical protein